MKQCEINNGNETELPHQLLRVIHFHAMLLRDCITDYVDTLDTNGF